MINIKFYRYQGTKYIENTSRYVDLELLYEDLDEYKNEFSSKGELLDYLYGKYKMSLSLRNIESKELFEKVVNGKNYSEVNNLTYKYPINGLFGEDFNEINKYYTLNKLLEECPWHCENNKFLAVYEGELILNEGDCGLIFKPLQLIDIFRTNI